MEPVARLERKEKATFVSGAGGPSSPLRDCHRPTASDTRAAFLFHGELDRDDDEDWVEGWDNWPGEEGEPYGCPYCYCPNLTIAGEVYSDCLAGVHQG